MIDSASSEDLKTFASWIMGLDRLIHEPSRLAILMLLRRSGSDYLFIQWLTGLSKGNLSNHLAKLEKAGLVRVHKHFEGKKPVTTLHLTTRGREILESYWDGMRVIAVGLVGADSEYSQGKCRQR